MLNEGSAKLLSNRKKESLKTVVLLSGEAVSLITLSIWLSVNRFETVFEPDVDSLSEYFCPFCSNEYFFDVLMAPFAKGLP